MSFEIERESLVGRVGGWPGSPHDPFLIAPHPRGAPCLGGWAGGPDLRHDRFLVAPIPRGAPCLAGFETWGHLHDSSHNISSPLDCARAHCIDSHSRLFSPHALRIASLPTARAGTVAIRAISLATKLLYSRLVRQRGSSTTVPGSACTESKTSMQDAGMSVPLGQPHWKLGDRRDVHRFFWLILPRHSSVHFCSSLSEGGVRFDCSKAGGIPYIESSRFIPKFPAPLYHISSPNPTDSPQQYSLQNQEPGAISANRPS